MDIKKAIEKELNQPMSRKEFLARSAGVALSLVGAGVWLRSLQRAGKELPANGERRRSGRGYGSSSYGGR